MATGKIVVLSLLISQAVSAPSGCTELCTSSYQRAYRGESSSGYQDQAGLTQALIADNARPGNWTEHNRFKTDGGRGNVYEERGQVVQGPKTIRYYRKNYTSSYSSGNPAGWSSVSQQQNSNAGATGGLEHRRGWSQSELENSNSQMTIGSGLSSSSQHSEYENMQSQRVNSISPSGGTSARLEDFGEYHEGSQQSGHSQGYQQSSTEPGNWKRVNSYKTDGGNGQVHEEEGQYQTGPKRVRYYRRNYTSGYSTGGPVGHGLPEPVVGTDMMQEIQKMREQFHSSSDWHSSGSTFGLNGDNVQPEGLTTDHRVDQGQMVAGLSLGQDRMPALYPAPTQSGLVSESRSAFQKHESYVTKMQPVYHAAPTPVSQVDANYRRSHFNRETEQGRLDQFRGAEDMNTHQSAMLDNQMIYNGGHRLTALPSAGTDHGSHFRQEWQSSSHVSGGTNSQAAQQANYNYRNQYNNRHGSYRTGQTHETHVSQLEGDSLQTTHNVAPEKLLNGVINMGRDADCTQETQQMQYRTQYHRSYKRGANYDEQHQQSQDITQQNQEFGQLHDQTSDSQQVDDMQQTGHIEFGQQSEDLTQQNEDLTQQTTGQLESGQQHQHLEDFSQQNQDLTQQTSGKLEFGQQEEQQQHQQHLEDFSQQNQDLTQQTSGKLEFGQQEEQQQHQQHLEDLSQQNQDLTQQTSGKLEFGQQHDQQQHQQHSEDFTQQDEDLTQQTSGKLEFGQQHDQQQHQQHSEDFTQQDEDLTQQTSGKLEFGQQHDQQQHQQHSEDFTQQDEDLTQQTSGKLEFGQQHDQQQHQQHSEDFTQQDEDLTQQTSGKLEFGQQHDQQQHQQHSEDLTQQNEDLTQQTSGKLEFGQQHDQQQHQQHSEDLTQQNEDLTQQTSGNLEFGQQHDQQQHQQHSDDFTQQNEDLTQQTSGKLEFGQQHDQQQHQQHSEDFTQQDEDLTQQTSGKLEFGQQHDQQQHQQHSEDLTQQNEDLTQQTSGKLEFGQQHDQHHHQQHSQDFTQQNEDLTQQTSGKLEFGQQHDQQQHQQHSDDFTQQNEDLTQQTSGKLEFGQHDQQHSEDFTQQTSGKLEFGQHQGHHQHADDFTQQSSDDDLMQQTGHLELGQQSQQPWGQDIDGQQHEDFTQQNQDLTQQTDKDLEFGQQSQYPWKPSRHSQQHTHRPEQDKYAVERTVGKLEFGQETQRTEADDMTKPTTRNPEFGHPQRGQGPNNGQSGSEGKLEFGQQLPGQSSEHTGEPGFGQQEQFPPEFHQTTNSGFPGSLDSYSQPSGYEFGLAPPSRYPPYDNYYEQSQHESGKLDVGQQRQGYHPWAPGRNQEGMHQNNEDLTQQVGKWEFGPYYRTPYRPYPAADSEKDKDTNKDAPVIPLAGFGQTPDQVINRESQHAQTVPPKPAQKPKPRPRYTRPVQEQNPSAPNNQDIQEHESTEGGDTPVIDLSPLNPNVDIEVDTDDDERENSRGDQGPRTSTTTAMPNDWDQQSQVNSYSMSRGHTEHSSWLHNSNDATVGLQWHYAYHPSDLTNSEPTSSHYPGHSYSLSSSYDPAFVQPGQEGPPYWTPMPEPTSRPPPPSGVKTSRRHRPPSQYWRGVYSTQNPLGNNYNELPNQQQNGQSLDKIQEPRQVGHLESGFKPGSDGLQQQEGTTGKIGIEPRILSAFAVSHGIRPNEYPDGAMPDPRVTLPPVDNEDPWDIRNVVRTTPEPTTTTTEPTTTTPAPTTTPKPSFWNRVGSEINKTAKKVGDAFQNIFSGK